MFAHMAGHASLGRLWADSLARCQHTSQTQNSWINCPAHPEYSCYSGSLRHVDNFELCSRAIVELCSLSVLAEVAHLNVSTKAVLPMHCEQNVRTHVFA